MKIVAQMLPRPLDRLSVKFRGDLWSPKCQARVVQEETTSAVSRKAMNELLVVLLLASSTYRPHAGGVTELLES